MAITRRDTIILAALLNLVVLVGVFVTARQVLPSGDKKTVEGALFGVEEMKEGKDAAKEEDAAALDEIDQLLEEYDAKGKVASKVTEAEQKPEKKEKSLPKKALPSKDSFYVVRPGDNPWKIAKKFHISFEKLLELNNLDEAKAKNLKVGQTLRIKES